MLTVRKKEHADESTWVVVAPESIEGDFYEDTHYELRVERPNCQVFVDDIELLTSAGWYLWQPSFYSGRVCIVVVDTTGHTANYFIEVGPANKKSAAAEFEEMVQTIRDFDQSLLGGESAATMAFGNESKVGLNKALVLLARLRLHGHDFLDSVSRIAQSPHQRLSADRQQVPLPQVRRIHPSALRDRRLSSLITSPTASADLIENLRIHSWTSAPTVDTPANRALLSLLKRFRATVVELRNTVNTLRLPEDKKEQQLRIPRRLQELDVLEQKAKLLIQRPPFSQIKSGEIGSSGLTQIAAQPEYNRAYRQGCSALTYQVNGADPVDQLRVNFSWGIYETWCYLETLKCLQQVLGKAFAVSSPKAASADLAFIAHIAPDHSVELLFQASFPAEKYSARLTWSISRQRYPDILVVERKGAETRSMILDAKWRSGRANVLEAMESAHIYHDSLRIDSQPPSPCLLLLPGASDVGALEDSEFIRLHGVGAVFGFSAHGVGMERLKEHLMHWFGLAANKT